MIDHLHELINCAGAGRWSGSKQWRFCPALFFLFLKIVIQWRESISMTAQSVGGSLENVREVGECERNHQNDGKRAIGSLWLGFWSSLFKDSADQWTVCLCALVCCFHRGQCYLVGAKIPRLSDHRNRTARGCVQGKNTGWSDSSYSADHG